MMLQKDELKQKIIQANSLYREGSPIMDDIQFDELVEQYQEMVSEDEYAEFRDSLHEAKGKVKHPFVMGSLDKLKIEEPKEIIKFLKSIDGPLNISAKVDGISCRLQYKKGKLISASTRGDGSFGEDLTDKIAYVKFVPNDLDGNLQTLDEVNIRGELVILKDDFASMTGFANPRNACAGIMNRKEWSKDDVTNVSFIAYTILGDEFTKQDQFRHLSMNGFKTAWNENITNEIDYSAIVDSLKGKAEQEFEYETDGLVVCSGLYKNEKKYRPDMCRAVKINQLVATTKLIDIAWEGPSKDGFMIPVSILDPVSLGGSTISRAALHNIDFIEEKGIKYGSVVKILKSGDIIPKIVEVISSEDATDIVYPDICPCCGSPLTKDGINLRCQNKSCKDQTTYQVMHFIRKLDVESTSFKTLQRFKIFTYDGLLKFRADLQHKSEMKLEDELKNKVFSRSKKDIFAALNFRGLSETLLTQIIDFYGMDVILNEGPFAGLPKGIGEITFQKFKDDLHENIVILNKIISDPRYSYNESAQSSTKMTKKMNGMSICFTGALSISRNAASKLASDAGFEVKSGVTKGLTYLVTNTPDSGSSKNKKAKQLGIHVITEKKFLELIDDNTVESDITSI